MPASIIVAVRTALVDGLTDTLVDDQVQVTYGYQGAETTNLRKQIYTNLARATHEPASLRAGRNFREESAEFEVVILIKGVAQKAEETEQECMDLGLVLEEFIADHKGNQLAIAGLKWIQVSGFELVSGYASTGTISQLTYTVTYNARLE